ncbi:MAG: tail fiber domain-containing protein, partial [Candidatus Korobacteraceae bacterium]
TFSGLEVGFTNVSGSYNSLYGDNAGYSNNTGSYNTFIGHKAGYSNTSGQKNTFSGLLAGFSNTTGSDNLFDGENAGYRNTTGSDDVYLANQGPTSGSESNTIRIGTQGTGEAQQNAAYVAGIYGSTTSSGVAVLIDSTGKLGTGGGAGIVTSFNGRTGAVLPAANDYSLSQLSGRLVSSQLSGTYGEALNLNNHSNEFAGNGAGLLGVLPAAGSPNYIQNGTAPQLGTNFNISGNGTLGGALSATFVNAATNYNISGSTVLSIASGGLYLGIGAGTNTTGIENTFSGNNAGNSNTTGAANAFFGDSAGFSNVGGSYNAFYGHKTGYSNTAGQNNTFAGLFAGYSNTTGSDNVFYGQSAGYGNTTGSNDVYIANPGASSGTESNTIRIGWQGSGAGQQNAAYIAGIFGSTSSSGVPVFVNSDGLLGTLTSSMRFKEQINDMGDSTSALMKLRPVTFFYKPEYDKGERTLQYGLLAEEVARVYPELVAYDKDGQPYTVRYQYLASMLLNEVQKQYRQAQEAATVIQAQQKEIESLKGQLQMQNADLQERMSRLEKLVGNQAQTIALK